MAQESLQKSYETKRYFDHKKSTLSPILKTVMEKHQKGLASDGGDRQNDSDTLIASEEQNGSFQMFKAADLLPRRETFERLSNYTKHRTYK